MSRLSAREIRKIIETWHKTYSCVIICLAGFWLETSLQKWFLHLVWT
jgi:hypothetical protein